MASARAGVHLAAIVQHVQFQDANEHANKSVRRGDGEGGRRSGSLGLGVLVL